MVNLCNYNYTHLSLYLNSLTIISPMGFNVKYSNENTVCVIMHCVCGDKSAHGYYVDLKVM